MYLQSEQETKMQTVCHQRCDPQVLYKLVQNGSTVEM